MRTRVRVIAGMVVRMIVRVLVRVIVPVCIVPMRIVPVTVAVVVRRARRERVFVRRSRGVVSARLRLERATRRRDLEAHASEQLGEHVVRLEHEAIGADLERNVAIAEVVRGLGERERRARRVARSRAR